MPPIDELTRIVLACSVESGDGRMLPAGSTGTVVGVYPNGAAYEVEFTQPFHVVATVTPAAIRAMG